MSGQARHGAPGRGGGPGSVAVPDDVVTRAARRVAERFSGSQLVAASPVPVNREGRASWQLRFDGPTLPAGWRAPLVLHVWDEPDPASRSVALLRWCTTHDIAAPEVLDSDPSGAALGCPHLLHVDAGTATVADEVAHHPWHAHKWFRAIGEAHARLHLLDPSDTPLPDRPALVERRLAQLAARLPDGDQRADQAIDWLHGHASLVRRERPAVCHGEFLPDRLRVGPGGALTVADWDQATAGDPHQDVAATLTSMRVTGTGAWPASSRLRAHLARRYVHAYTKLRPVDGRRLAYWLALQAVDLWARLPDDERAGPAATRAWHGYDRAVARVDRR